jgi:hypothetical protein
MFWLRADIDANDCLDCTAGLDQSSYVAAFDWGGEESRDRGLLAIGVAQPKYQRAKHRSHNRETHVAIIPSQFDRSAGAVAR